MKQRLTKGELLRRRHVMRRPITAIHVELWPLASGRPPDRLAAPRSLRYPAPAMPNAVEFIPSSR
jgi:hypothetical protein